MNYLGHAFLSFSEPELLLGNMVADHVKGMLAVDALPAGIRKGVLLHRAIDRKADAHRATARAKILFRQDYGLYAGAITDVVYDHFLANDPRFFPDEASLRQFSAGVYEMLESLAAYFPQRFAGYFPSMKQHDWLFHYRFVKGMERSLNGLRRRAQYMPPVEKAYDTFVSQYFVLNQCYLDFIDDMISFVKIESQS